MTATSRSNAGRARSTAPRWRSISAFNCAMASARPTTSMPSTVSSTLGSLLTSEKSNQGTGLDPVAEHVQEVLCCPRFGELDKRFQFFEKVRFTKNVVRLQLLNRAVEPVHCEQFVQNLVNGFASGSDNVIEQ